MRQVEKVAAVNRQRVDLIFRNNVADTSLIRIDLKCTCIYLDSLARGTDGKLEISTRRRTSANNSLDRKLLKSCGIYSHRVRPRSQRPEAIETAGIGLQ